jgi:hypothetical protein
MMNARTLWHGGEPKKSISSMLSLLLINLWDRRLKWRESLALQVFARIYIVLGWAWRILKFSLAFTRIDPRMLGLGVLQCKNS